jgi:hypothetical protein
MAAKKFQIFLSSTFLDLQQERSVCVTSLLRLGAIPMGMELFPASDKAQWDIIRSLIPECDYYVLITAGRYGSMLGDVSYTEAEYDLAYKLGVPVIPFLHKSPQERFDPTEDAQAQERLKAFHAKLKAQHTPQFWGDLTELTALLFQSVLDATSRIERPGWVRGDQVASDETLQRLITLTKENDDLKARTAALEAQVTPPPSDLSAGDDRVTLHGKAVSSNSVRIQWAKSVSWNEILRTVGPGLRQPLADNFAVDLFDRFVYFNEETRRCEERDRYYFNINVDADDANMALAHLQALGFLTSEISSNVKGGMTCFWQLTPKGNQALLDLLVVRKEERG